MCENIVPENKEILSGIYLESTEQPQAEPLKPQKHILNQFHLKKYICVEKQLVICTGPIGKENEL